MAYPAPNPKVAPRLRRQARVTAYTRPDKRDTRDLFRLLKNVTALKSYVNTDFRSGTLGNLMFEILENDRVQSTQWGQTVKRFLDQGLEP